MMSRMLDHTGLCLHLPLNHLSVVKAVIYVMFVVVASEKMESMGYSRKEVEEALTENKYDNVMATYLLLSRKVAEVC